MQALVGLSVLAAQNYLATGPSDRQSSYVVDILFFVEKQARVPNMRKISSQTPSGTRSIVKGLICSTAVAALVASAPVQANDMDEMRTELQNLLDRMERVEQTQVGQQVAVETAAPLVNRTYIRKRARKMRSLYEPYDVRDLYIMPETARANGVVGGD